MTLDEAIKYYKGMSNFYKSEFHKEGAEKCSQLAEWLEELKELRKLRKFEDMPTQR